MIGRRGDLGRRGEVRRGRCSASSTWARPRYWRRRSAPGRTQQRPVDRTMRMLGQAGPPRRGSASFEIEDIVGAYGGAPLRCFVVASQGVWGQSRDEERRMMQYTSADNLPGDVPLAGQSRFKWIQLGRQYGTASIDAITSGFLGERGGGGKFFLPAISAHFRPFPLIFGHCGHFQPLPPISAIWCPDRLAVSGDLKIGTAFNTAFRLEIRHEAWQEPSVIKTRLPCVPWGRMSNVLKSAKLAGPPAILKLPGGVLP